MFMQKLNSDIDLFLKMGQTRPLFGYFAIFVDGVLGSRTRGGRIESRRIHWATYGGTRVFDLMVRIFQGTLRWLSDSNPR